jgi:hypothetical protein
MGSGPLKRNLILANFTDPNSPASRVTRETTAAGSGLTTLAVFIALGLFAAGVQRL